MPTLTDMAWGSLNSLLNDPSTHQSIMDRLGQGNITPDDLNEIFPTIQNWTGSGRQSAGQTDIESLWFDQSGNALIRDPMSGGFMTSDQVTNSFTQDAGVPWYDPFRPDDYQTEFYDPARSGMNWNPTTRQYEHDTTDNFYRWSELDSSIQDRITNQGLFQNLVEDFASTANANHAEDWGLNDIGTIDQSNINSIMENLIGRQSYLANNTTQNESEGWLLNDGLPTLFSTVGSFVGGPVGGFLNLSGNLMNTGNALSNENYGSALMSGLGVYNQAGNLANAATGTNTYQQFSPQDYIEDYLPDLGGATPYLSGGLVSGAVSALDGNDFGTGFMSGVTNQATQDISNAIGIPSAGGLVGMGLQSLFSNNPQPSNTTAGSGGGSNNNTGGGGGSTGGGETSSPVGNVIQTNPYQVFNPSQPTYTNPFAGVQNPYLGSTYGDIPYNESLDATDLSDTNNPYNTALNYNGYSNNPYT